MTVSSFNLKSPLTLESLERIALGKARVLLPKSLEHKMTESLKKLALWTKEGETIYGINTGVGALSDVRIEGEKLNQLQLNIVRSHSTGVGPYFSEEEARAIVLLRAHMLSQGYSGVRPLVVKTLLSLLNKNLIPLIPQKGSVGASGDLAPLAHLALALIGEGEVIFKSKKVPAQRGLRLAKISPLKLEGREGLALINGTQVMTALSSLNLLKAERLFKLFNVASALSLEAIQGSKKAFDPDLHLLRPHEGQKIVAKNILRLIQGSHIQKNHEFCGRVQDSYSFRCIPQVHGSSQDALQSVKKIVEVELNAITDNPVLFSQKNKWISGGNFHGQYLAQAMDFLSIATTTLVNISERRIEKLLDPKFSGLPPFLVQGLGLDSGLMLAHVTAAALASENKVLSHPASVDTIPTSANKEDHVSMGVHAARKTKEILSNAEEVLAIEFLAASQGIECLRPLKTSPVLEKIMSLIRSKVPPIEKDRIFSQDITTMKTLFSSFLSSIERIIP